MGLNEIQPGRECQLATNGPELKESVIDLLQSLIKWSSKQMAIYSSFINIYCLAIRYKEILHSLFLFFLAGLCEIGGGYLIWLLLREDYGWIFGAFGGLVLFLYGVVPTFQKSYFHRIYAAYGGIFIVMALSWGFFFEGIIPDTFDILGTVVASIGIIIIFYCPRKPKDDKIGISSSA